MLRVNSEVLRNNHHSLNKKFSPLSLQNSKADSVNKNRKMSMTSLKENIPDLEKLIMDIKISPMSHGVSNSDQDHVRTIMKSLRALERNANIKEDVATVSLLMETIERRLKTNIPCKKLQFNENSGRKYSEACTSAKFCDVSPIKQISDDTNSRILYTNFSLKDIDPGSFHSSIKEISSLQSSNSKSALKVSVSKFQQGESCQNSEVDRLNDQIKYLENLLRKKTDASGCQKLFKKKSNMY